MFSMRFNKRMNDLMSFREKNKDHLLKNNTKYKELTAKQIRVHREEGTLLNAASNSADKFNSSESMYFIRLWLEFEAYQIDLITKFLLLNDDKLKTIIKKLAGKIKDMPKLKSAH